MAPTTTVLLGRQRPFNPLKISSPDGMNCRGATSLTLVLTQTVPAIQEDPCTNRAMCNHKTTNTWVSVQHPRCQAPTQEAPAPLMGKETQDTTNHSSCANDPQTMQASNHSRCNLLNGVVKRSSKSVLLGSSGTLMMLAAQAS